MVGQNVVAMIETFRGVVYPEHHDHMDHMNVQWYTAFFDQATWSLFSRAGITATYLRENARGMVAVKQNTLYKQEAIAGDPLVIESGIRRVRRTSVQFEHVMLNAETGEELATTELTGVHIDRGTRQSCPLPAEIRQRIERMIGAE